MKIAKCISLCLIIFISLFSHTTSAQSLFTNGQDANVLLGPYESEANASNMHWPSTVYSDGERLFVADTRNNRILIWNSIPTQTNQPADIVVGQQDFTSIYSGNGPDKLNWPVGVYSDGVRMFVADTENYRVLIWNNIPTSNGEPADLVLGQPDFYTIELETDFSASTIKWPWDVFYDGTRLYVANSLAGRVMVWNSLPTVNNQAADYVLGRENFTVASPPGDPDNWNMHSPRSIASDGQRLAIWDYTWQRIMIWNTIPTQTAQPADLVIGQPNFYTDEGSNTRTDRGLVIKNGKLYNFGERVYVWDTFPTDNNQSPDHIWNVHNSGWGMTADDDNIYVANTGNSKILIYHDIPDEFLADPDLILGEEVDRYSTYLDKAGMGNVSGVFSNGKNLFISAIEGRIISYDDLPDFNAAEADNLISIYDWGYIPQPAYEDIPISALYSLWSDGKILLAGDDLNGILIWDNIPDDYRELWDRKITPESYINSDEYFYPSGIAAEGNKVFLSARYHNKILVWNDISELNGNYEPDFTLDLDNPCQIAIDKGRMVVAGGFGHNVHIYNTIPDSPGDVPDIDLVGTPHRFNGVTGVAIHDDKLFVADNGFHRICIYNTIPTSADQPYDIVLGQDDLNGINPGISRNEIHNPNQISFDGEYLWMEEFKFGDRVMGWKASIDQVAPTAPSNFSGNLINQNKIKFDWTDNSSNERGFILYHKSGEQGNYEILHYIKTNCETVTIDPLVPGTSHYFYLVAYNSYGESEASETLEFTLAPAENNAPNIPTNPFPANGSMYEFNQHMVLKWDCTDVDEYDQLRYDIYLGLSSPPPLLVSDVVDLSYYDMTHGYPVAQTYYWQVVAKDGSGQSTASPIWNFYTPEGTWGSMMSYTLSVGADNGGQTNPIPGDYRFSLPQGSSSGLNYIYAIPDEGNTFTGWVGDIDVEHMNDNPLEVMMDSDKNITATFLVTDVVNDKIPIAFQLSQNYPNPFNPTTKLKYSIMTESHVKLSIYNILGEKVCDLVDDVKKAGHHEIYWSGRQFASGVYIYKIIANPLDGSNSFSDIKKMILLK